MTEVLGINPHSPQWAEKPGRRGRPRHSTPWCSASSTTGHVPATARISRQPTASATNSARRASCSKTPAARPIGASHNGQTSTARVIRQAEEEGPERRHRRPQPPRPRGQGADARRPRTAAGTSPASARRRRSASTRRASGTAGRASRAAAEPGAGGAGAPRRPQRPEERRQRDRDRPQLGGRGAAREDPRIHSVHRLAHRDG